VGFLFALRRDASSRSPRRSAGDATNVRRGTGGSLPSQQPGATCRACRDEVANPRFPSLGNIKPPKAPSTHRGWASGIPQVDSIVPYLTRQCRFHITELSVSYQSASTILTGR
jgi:hypothetical protein